LWQFLAVSVYVKHLFLAGEGGRRGGGGGGGEDRRRSSWRIGEYAGTAEEVGSSSD
jgi:hypothetical protein